MCISCQVVLCKKKRWTSDYKLIDVNWKGNPHKSLATLSCNDVWHTNKDLPVISESCCSKLNVNHTGSSSLIRPAPVARVVGGVAAPAVVVPAEDPVPVDAEALVDVIMDNQALYSEDPVPVDNQALVEYVDTDNQAPVVEDAGGEVRAPGGPIRHVRGSTLGARRRRRQSNAMNTDAIRRSNRTRNPRS